jgi:hypothetical protein
MKRNVSFITVIVLILIAEIYCFEVGHKDSFWTNNFRVLSLIAMSVWYFIQQKGVSSQITKAFFLSILLPIIVSISTFLIVEKYAIIINICVNIAMLSLWIYCFRQLGASISSRDSNKTLTKLIPAYFILPLFFYIFALYQSLTANYALIVLLYISILSYTGILSAFLPINEEKKIWIIVGIATLVFVNGMNAYHTFLQKIAFAYPIIRVITVVAKIMIIYGMIDVKHKNANKLYLEN